MVQLQVHNSVEFAWGDLVWGMSCWPLPEWYNTLESVRRGTIACHRTSPLVESLVGTVQSVAELV